MVAEANTYPRCELMTRILRAPQQEYWPERRARRGVRRDRAVAMASMALPKRSTRGMRMNKLLEDEDSADEEFWNQDAFAEEEGDGVYESESEKEDVFDSDFDEDESSSDEEEVHVARERTKKVLKAPERKPVKPEGGAGAVPRKPKAPRVKPDPALFGFPMEDSEAVTWEDGVRKSSRAIVKDIRSKSEAAREAAARRPAPKRDPNQGVYKPMTQAEILAEAALTEVRNLRDLEHLLNIEEATKKKAERVKKTHTHPCLRVRSVAADAADNGGRESRTTIELRFGASTPPPLGAGAPRAPRPATCAVTGKPARYRDPLTGQGYHDVAAFKELRRRRETGGDDDGLSDDDDDGDDVEMEEADAPAPCTDVAPEPASAKRFVAPGGGAGTKKAKKASLNDLAAGKKFPPETE